jgi:hypothetical protein
MPRYLLAVTYQDGDMPPMTEWEQSEIKAHLDYCAALHGELVASGELVDSQVLTGPEVATVVTGDGVGAPVRADRPFAGVEQWVAGYQVVEVESEQRAVEIAAKVSAVPGVGGVPTRQPIQVRRVLDQVPGDVGAMDDYLRSGT